MKLSLSKNLAPLRAQALLDIDAQAETVRGFFITPGSGQALVYDQKRAEAETYMADPAAQHSEIPHLVSEAAMNGISLFDQAVDYLTMRQMWLTISPAIEMRRLAAKAAVASAQTPAAIAVAGSIDWSDIAPGM